MNTNDLKSDLCKKLKGKDYCFMYDLLADYIDYAVEDEQNSDIYESIIQKIPINKIRVVRDENVVLSKMIKVRKILEEYKNANLIEILEGNELKTGLKYYGSTGYPAIQVNKYLESEGSKVVYPFDAIEEFISNNLKTESDLELLLERDQRKKSEKFTKIIAILSMIVSIASVTLSIVLNEKDRNVFIKSWPDDSKSIKIENKS